MATGTEDNNWSEGLTDKESAFAAAFLRGGGNQASAAREAGYSQPEKQGWEVYQRPHVREAIKKLGRATGMTPEEALARLAAQARGSLGDCLSLDEEGKIKFDLDKAMRTGGIHVIQELRITADEVRIKVYSAQRALETVLKCLGLLNGPAEKQDEGPWRPPQEFFDDLERAYQDRKHEASGELSAASAIQDQQGAGVGLVDLPHPATAATNESKPNLPFQTKSGRSDPSDPPAPVPSSAAPSAESVGGCTVYPLQPPTSSFSPHTPLTAHSAPPSSIRQPTAPASPWAAFT